MGNLYEKAVCLSEVIVVAASLTVYEILMMHLYLKQKINFEPFKRDRNQVFPSQSSVL